MKKFFLLVLCLVLMTSILSACNSDNTANSNKELPINYIEGDAVIDMENPREVVGLGDYVFVAFVNEEIDTRYTNVREREDGKTTGIPHTIYSITVIDNLKGNLKKNTPIEFEKFGGVNMDKKSISLFEGDELLEVGKFYIMIASAEPDGTLGYGGPNAAIKLNYESKSEIISSQEYKDYKKYVKEQIKFERERFKSTYED